MQWHKTSKQSIHQFGNRLAVIKQLHWSTGEIIDLLVIVDPQSVINRANHVLGADSPRRRAFAANVCFANHLALVDRTSEQGKARVRPMVAAS